jgi:hypothetical protein
MPSATSMNCNAFDSYVVWFKYLIYRASTLLLRSNGGVSVWPAKRPVLTLNPQHLLAVFSEFSIRPDITIKRLSRHA